MTRSLTPSRLAAPLSGAIAFAVYLMTLAPGVGFIDSGELAAVASTLGVAHPTGYPLFTLLGWVFAHLPFGPEEIVRLNVMAALLSSLAVSVFAVMFIRILRAVAASQRIRLLKQVTPDAPAIAVSGAAGALLLAFSETYWSTALSVEVYALHLLMLSLTLLTFLKAAFPEAPREGRPTVRRHWWTAFAFVLGLSFTNHMTTILLAPGLLYLYIATQGTDRPAWRRIGAMAGPFLLGLSVYLYLPLRAAHQPALNWGNPAGLERFLWHVGGKQYRVWIFSSTDAAGRQLTYFINSLPAEFAVVGLLLALAGLVLLWRAHRRLAVGTVLLFTGCVLYSINYDIHDIDSYFLLAYVTCALCAAVALLVLWAWLHSSWRWAAGLTGSAVLLPALIALVVNSGKVDESENHLVPDYTMNMFASFQPNALVFSYQWDYWVSASYYYQLVRGVRPDVTVVDKELLRRSWYFNELETRYPWLIAGTRRAVDAFRAELYKFEHDLPYDPALIEARYVGMINAMIRTGMETRPVYVTHEIEPQFTGGLQRAPEGLAFRLWRDSLFHPTPRPEFRYRPLGRGGRLPEQVPRIYAGALTARGLYYYRAGDRQGAREAVLEALRVNPGNTEALRALSLVEGPM